MAAATAAGEAASGLNPSGKKVRGEKGGEQI